MTMLSRVAERIFWMARYMERTQDMARMTNAFSQLLMDLPSRSKMEWDTLIRILDAEDTFLEKNRVFSEQNVMRFVIADDVNPSSIMQSIKAARENVRTTRGALPEDVWEYTNELYLYSRDMAEKSIGRRNRYTFLEEVIGYCQRIDGLIATTLSRNHTYRFVKIGQLLERADMTSRIIDVGAAEIAIREEDSQDLSPLIWASILRSLSAISTYREYFGPLVETDSIVSLVFKESTMPRSIIFCLREIREHLQHIENNSFATKEVVEAIAMLEQFNIKKTDPDTLKKFIDSFQIRLNTINYVIAQTWFERH